MDASPPATRRPFHAGLVRLVGHKLPTWLRVTLVATFYLVMIAVNVASTSNAGIFKDKGPKYFAGSCRANAQPRCIHYKPQNGYCTCGAII